ncbi:WXG100 family type VII secretion target [Glycomyces tarimensis]
MSDSSLVADVESTRRPWTGAGLADGIEGLVMAIDSGSWVQGTLAGVGLGLEVVGSAMDPFSALLANGLGWAMEYFEPLREMLDWLTGKPDVVMSHAQTWFNMADELFAMSTDLGTMVNGDIDEWSGAASDAYYNMMGHNVEGIGGLGAVASAIGAATEGAGALVQMTRDLVRDLIADLVAHVVVWAVEAIFVVTIPAIAAQIVGAVVKWSGIILQLVTSLLTSIEALSKLLND